MNSVEIAALDALDLLVVVDNESDTLLRGSATTMKEPSIVASALCQDRPFWPLSAQAGMQEEREAQSKLVRLVLNKGEALA